ncbi:hypothetical protein CEQ31_017635 [Serratia odorifera]|uniref:Uncharacterized protein n=1 Tax=Serratia odorifera DSM 4582 TaxID=667129 RepID=D4E041_SEROD|nr:hypothetical protein HMPREF0758_1541 [Serratia odorifera DSM 4582]PNK91369.1 hypothetical protein CEQ31_017635 [Serratia odorifera]RII72542.1 hypothetical protein DX901_08795 [Serratia odorifera]
MSQYLLGVSKANVLIINRARMLRREEKACQHVRQDNRATIHRDDRAVKTVVQPQINAGGKAALIAGRGEGNC